MPHRFALRLLIPLIATLLATAAGTAPGQEQGFQSADLHRLRSVDDAQFSPDVGVPALTARWPTAPAPDHAGHRTGRGSLMSVGRKIAVV
jgi:hypothetical protein